MIKRESTQDFYVRHYHYQLEELEQKLGRRRHRG